MNASTYTISCSGSLSRYTVECDSNQGEKHATYHIPVDDGSVVDDIRYGGSISVDGDVRYSHCTPCAMHPKITSTTPTRGSFPAADPVVSGAAGAKNVVLATNTIATNITMIPE